MEAAVQSSKKGKLGGIDNIPAELVQAGGEDVITALTTQTGEWPTLGTQSLVITLPKKSNLQQCQNYRLVSLIGHHTSKVTLRIMLNRLKLQAEKIVAVSASPGLESFTPCLLTGAPLASSSCRSTVGSAPYARLRLISSEALTCTWSVASHQKPTFYRWMKALTLVLTAVLTFIQSKQYNYNEEVTQRILAVVYSIPNCPPPESNCRWTV